jgi:hypothetical protein
MRGRPPAMAWPVAVLLLASDKLFSVELASWCLSRARDCVWGPVRTKGLVWMKSYRYDALVEI